MLDNNANVTVHFSDVSIANSNWRIHGLNVIAMDVDFGNITHLSLSTADPKYLTMHQETFETIIAVNSQITISYSNMNGKNKGKGTLLNIRSSTLRLNKCQFYNFEQDYIWHVILAASSNVTMENMEVINNTLKTDFTLVRDSSRLMVTNSIFMDNKGKLFWANNQSSIVVVNCSVSNNGGLIMSSSKTTATVKYSFIENTIVVSAGGTDIWITLIGNEASDSKLSLYHSSYITTEVFNCSFTLSHYVVLFDINIETNVNVIGTNFTGTGGSPRILYPYERTHVKVNFTGCIFSGKLIILHLWRSLASIERSQIIYSSSINEEIFYLRDSLMNITETKIMFHNQTDQPFLTVWGSSLTMIGSVYSGNTVYSHFLVKENSNISIYDCLFNNNTATAELGNSAIFNVDNSRAKIQNTTLTRNSAEGEVILKAYSSVIELKTTTIAGNSRLSSGCILNVISSNMRLTECRLVLNPLPPKGGCFIHVSAEETTVNNYFWATKCTIVNSPGVFRLTGLSYIIFENSLIIHNATIDVYSVAPTRISNSILINRKPRIPILEATNRMTLITFNNTFIKLNSSLKSSADNFVPNAIGKRFLGTRYQMTYWETIYASCEYFLFLLFCALILCVRAKIIFLNLQFQQLN